MLLKQACSNACNVAQAVILTQSEQVRAQVVKLVNIQVQQDRLFVIHAMLARMLAHLAHSNACNVVQAVIPTQSEQVLARVVKLVNIQVQQDRHNVRHVCLVNILPLRVALLVNFVHQARIPRKGE